MESLVYQDSPLADYLERTKANPRRSVGHGGSHFRPEEGERDEGWVPQEIPQETESEQTPPSPSPNFAPRGASTFQERIRNKLPAPLDLKSSRRTGLLGRIHDACSVAVSSQIGRSDNERFLEQFGYVIVASQLLNEHSAPSYTSAAGILSNVQVTDVPPLSATFGLQGALVTAATSFSVAWLVHWSRSRTGPGLNPRRVGVLLVLLPVIGAVFYAFAKRQWLKYVRHQAVEAASVLIGNAQGFDSAASASVAFIQEVELVSRGYRISTPLPPVSRLEENAQTRRCMRLRRVLSEVLFSMLERYLKAQRNLRPLADFSNLEKYYDIYDISTEELYEAEAGLSERGAEDQYSLRSLRTLFSRLYIVRKSILCCLLALSADGGGSDITRWSAAVEEMRELAVVTGTNIQKLTNILSEQDRDVLASSPLPTPSPGKDTLRTQFRKLNSLSQGIRALHAKMHVIREACEGSSNESDIGATLMAQYESIGEDIRELLQEWEAGKSALMSSLEKPTVPDRLSRSSSGGARSPLSPASSLGGTTAVEGSLAEALKVLNGEGPSYLSPDIDMDDEEVFEAVALPARKRSSMTREERIARVKEERARQAAARERAEANTKMLKELETVIKLRPRSMVQKRVTSI